LRVYQADNFQLRVRQILNQSFHSRPDTMHPLQLG
jgi:hypothetical protein